MIKIEKLQNNPYYIIEILALACGLLLPFSFAPFNFFWLQFPLIAYLFIVCVDQKPAVSFRRGLFFGLGWFAHGIHWIFYSLHLHGAMPAPLAIVTVLLLASVLSLFPAAAFYFSNRFIRNSRFIMLVLVYPVSWMIFDWLRGYVLTGFPWVQVGVAHVDTYLAGYGPLIGGLGIGLIVTVIAGLIAESLFKENIRKTLPVILVIYIAGYLVTLIEWTEPVDEPVKVSLIQGNIPQSEKWKRESYLPTLQMYRELTRKNWDSDLIIWPETAVPSFRSRVPAYLNELAEEANKTDTDVLLGLFVRNKENRRYYNSIITLDDQVYKKRHLVPLGEYFPLRSLLGFFAQWVNIPMSDIDNGESEQPMIKAAGQSIGISICFEDAFDRDVLLDLPEATLLVNVSNDAWSMNLPNHGSITRLLACVRWKLGVPCCG